MAPGHHGHAARSLDHDAGGTLDAICGKIIDTLKPLKPTETISIKQLAYRIGESKHNPLFASAMDRLLCEPSDGDDCLERVRNRVRLRPRGD